MSPTVPTRGLTDRPSYAAVIFPTVRDAPFGVK